MIHIGETLAIHSVEGFLTTEELAHLNKIMDVEAAGWRPRHPAEVLPAPAMAQEILARATERALPAIRRTMPSIAAAAPWAYIELRPGQAVPTHLDGITGARTAPRRLGRIGVSIAEPDAGGRFYAETTSDPAPWTEEVLGEADGYQPDTPLARSLPHAPEADGMPDWITPVPRTRWTADAAPGVALAYGAQLIHGVEPVRAGVLRKFVADLLDTPHP